METNTPTSWQQKKQIILACAFRPMFLLLPAYLCISILLWGLAWAGKISLGFTTDLLSWHMYEMIYGAASAGIIGFILTAIPEFFSEQKMVDGNHLLAIVSWWLVGRISFWMLDYLSIWWVAFTNISLLLWIIVLVIRPIITDPRRRHFGLAFNFIALTGAQVGFFLSMAGLIMVAASAWLKLALGIFMVLELLVLRRVNTGAINEWLEDNDIEETFLARPPLYNIAICCVLLFSAVEFLISYLGLPYQSILGWLGLAASAAILNLLNDFFTEEKTIFFTPLVLPLALILMLMAAGYGFMGVDYLLDDFYGINHFRHFLTTGVFGLSFLMIMLIVTVVHTGRPLKLNSQPRLINHPLVYLALSLALLATLLRISIAFWPAQAHTLYLASALLWGAPFIIYLWRFGSYLLQPRKDGLPG